MDNSHNLYSAPSAPFVQAESLVPEASKPRPWVRYWARMIDIYFIAIFAGIAVGLYDESVIQAKYFDRLISIGSIFLWIFVEAMFLSTFGYTFGKWLLGVEVLSSNGMRMGYKQAMSRGLKVWWRGLGIGIPLISFFTLLIAHAKLKADGITTWDKDDGNIVIHHNIGIAKTIISILVILGVFSLSIYGIVKNA